eukprot:Pgem_evm1s11258
MLFFNTIIFTLVASLPSSINGFITSNKDNVIRHCTGTCLQAASHTIMETVMQEKATQLEKVRVQNLEKEIRSFGFKNFNFASSQSVSTIAHSSSSSISSISTTATTSSGSNGNTKELSKVTCQPNGLAADYPCSNVDLVGYLPFSSMRGEQSQTTSSNDIWGWTDPKTNREYALAGQYDQTSVIDITNGILNPIIAIPRAKSTWSDIKVYKNHMYIGTEGGGGIQVYDLTQLRNYVNLTKDDAVLTVEPTTVYTDGVTSSHNVVINEETGYLYVVGSRTCAGGLHIVDIREPANPKFRACFSVDGYTHDAQCVIYKGPDQRYFGREICFNYNEDTLTIVDVENKDDMRLLSRTGYEGSKYTHQGWVTEDHTTLLLNDELDEKGATDEEGKYTHTYIWNIEDLEKPVYFSFFKSSVQAIDHNLYIKGDLAYLSNYAAGLRVLNVSDVKNGHATEVAYFDVYPEAAGTVFTGSWSSYPYFESGLIPVNSIDRGLFVVKLNFL